MRRVDWPSCNLWREHAALYPEAKVILTTRDPDSWYDSVMNTIYASSTRMKQSTDPNVRRFGEWACRVTWENLFDNRMHDRAHVIGVYNAHVERVKATIPKSRLLVFEAKQGWRPLCEFLGVDVPAEPYPRVNTTEDFMARNATRQ